MAHEEVEQQEDVSDGGQFFETWKADTLAGNHRHLAPGEAYFLTSYENGLPDDFVNDMIAFVAQETDDTCRGMVRQFLA